LASFETNLAHYPSPAEWDEIDILSQFLKFIRKREEGPTIGTLPTGMTGTSNWRGM